MVNKINKRDCQTK